MFCLLLACSSPLTQAPSALPLRRLHFYDNGLAYYERAGVADAGVPLTLEVAPAQLGGVLKSLVLMQDGSMGKWTLQMSKPEDQRASALMTLRTTAVGAIGVGYVCAAPQWRASYRIVSNDTDSRSLAWALIENDTNEAWQEVEVALASEAPDFGAAESSEVTAGVTQPESPDVHGEQSSALHSIANPVSIGAHSSLLVPLVDAKLGAQEIGWLEENAEHVVSALLVSNDGASVLAPGSLVWYSGGVFSGETTLDRLEPKEQQMLLFGSDLSLSAAREMSIVGDELHAVTFDPTQQTLTEHRVEKRQLRIVLNNRSQKARLIHCPLGELAEDSKIEGADAIVSDPQTEQKVAVVSSSPRSETRHVVFVEEQKQEEKTLTAALALELRTLAAAPGLTPATAAILREAGGVALRDRELLERGGRPEQVSRVFAALATVLSKLPRGVDSER